MLAVSISLANSDGSPEFQFHMISNAVSLSTGRSTHLNFKLPEVQRIIPPNTQELAPSLLPQCYCYSLRPPSLKTQKHLVCHHSLLLLFSLLLNDFPIPLFHFHSQHLLFIHAQIIKTYFQSALFAFMFPVIQPAHMPFLV